MRWWREAWWRGIEADASGLDKDALMRQDQFSFPTTVARRIVVAAHKRRDKRLLALKYSMLWGKSPETWAGSDIHRLLGGLRSSLARPHGERLPLSIGRKSTREVRECFGGERSAVLRFSPLFRSTCLLALPSFKGSHLPRSAILFKLHC